MPRTKIDGPGPKERILTAARNLFFEHGYDAVSTDMIAKHARVSKTTLYNQIGDKKSLLIAAVEKESERFQKPTFSSKESYEEYRQLFIDYGVNLLELCAEEELRRFDQMMLGQARINPDVSISFYQAAYQITIEHMETMIRFGQERAYVKRPHDPSLLTEIILHSWLGAPYHRAMYGFNNSYHQKPVERVETILNIVLGI